MHRYPIGVLSWPATLGYRMVDRARFPEKIRRDCLACPRRDACNEVCVHRVVSGASTRVA